MQPNSTPAGGPPPEDLMERCCRRPWETYVRPFPMAEGVWYISGNDWVACYLIDTGDGLILIDTAVHESLYLLLENVRVLGYRPTDIKKILLTHAHIDHIGGARPLKELTGAAIYMGARDMQLLENPELIGGDGTTTCGTFTPDEFYDDNRPVTLGKIAIETVSTPGHTPGCTSMFFDVTGKDGKTLRCGMHGGIGLNTLNREYLESVNMPLSLQTEFIESLEKLDKMHVDITLPSHTNQVEILPLRDKITDSFNPYIDPSVWHELMHKRLGLIRDIMEKENSKGKVR